jgi:hypothetical protein
VPPAMSRAADIGIAVGTDDVHKGELSKDCACLSGQP